MFKLINFDSSREKEAVTEKVRKWDFLQRRRTVKKKRKDSHPPIGTEQRSTFSIARQLVESSESIYKATAGQSGVHFLSVVTAGPNKWRKSGFKNSKVNHKSKNKIQRQWLETLFFLSRPGSPGSTVIF